MRGWRSFVVRRILARFRVGPDILRHLSTFQRLGESLEATPPGEMVPVGVRTVLRAIRTRGAVQIRPDWVWPFWVERQVDPASPAFIPRGHLPFMTNLTQRNWTMVGALESEWEGIVDPRGLVTAWFDGWSLDWWSHDSNGWHFPSKDHAVTQDLVEAVPVVRTALKVDSGRLEELVYCPLDHDSVVVELANHTDEEVELALAVRPYNPEGLAVVESLLLSGSTVLVDGRPGLFLPRPPDRHVVSTFRDGDTAALLSNEAAGPPEVFVKDPSGMIQAAFVYRVPAGESVRCAIPLPHHRREERRKRVSKKVVHHIPPVTCAQVVAGWKDELSRGMQVRLPDHKLQEAVDANRAYMKLFYDGDSITPGPFTYHRFWFRDAAYQLVAMARWGMPEEAAKVLSTFGDRQHRDGFFYSQWREWDSNGAALWAIAEYHRLTGDATVARALAPNISKGAQWITDKCRGREDDERVKGLFPPGVSAEHLGPYDYYYWDNFWGLRGLLDAEYLLNQLGDRQGAAAASAGAEEMHRAIMASLGMAAGRLGAQIMPAGPTRGIDAAMVGSLAACYPLGLFGAGDPWITGTARVIRERFCIEDAFFQQISHTGLGTYLTLQLAFVELEAQDPRAWQRLRWLLDHATPTYTWPEAIHPRLKGGCMGDGHHGWAAADFLSFVRNLLVRESGPLELAVLTLLPDEWRGAETVVRNAPTAYGELSYSLRWQGSEAVFEWEKSSAETTITLPALAPGWSSRDPQGTATFGDAGAKPPELDSGRSA